MMEIEEAELPGTPPRAGSSGGRGDEFLDPSTISISPDPIEKYIGPTPEKPPIILNIESGDPSPVGNSTRESTVSPTFQVKTDDSLSSSTPNHLTDEEEEYEKDDPENGIPEEEGVTEIIKAVEEITLMSIEPAQPDPTLQGDDDLEGSAHEGLNIEERELLEEDADGGDIEEDASNEPTQKRRIVYDRSTLLNYKAIANKDALQGIDSIPLELIRDEKSPANNIGPLPRTPGGGTFNAHGNRNATMGKMNNNNRQGAYPNRNMQMNTGQWGGLGVGGMSNKSSGFAQGKKQPPGESCHTTHPGVSRPDACRGLPKFAPEGGLGSARSGGSGPTGFGGVPKYLAPRFSRHPVLAEAPWLPHVQFWPLQSSRESSRPQTLTKESDALPPRSQASPPMAESNSIKEFDVAATVKNIFSEFMYQKELDYEWLHNRFPGKRVLDFVEELSRQACDMSKEEHQITAGSLIKNLVKEDLLTKAQIMNSLLKGVIPEMPDIEVDVPKATLYLAMFLVEVFLDEEDFIWLVELGEPLRLDFADSWTNLVTHTLNILKLRRSEEVVRGLYKETRQGANRLPIQNIPWVLGDTLESITAKMKTVLQGASAENLIALSRENSWDLREALTIQGLAETICTLCWPGTGEWDLDLLDRWLKEIKISSNTKLYHLFWQQAKDFMKRNNVGKQQEEFLWDVMMRNDLLIKD